MTTETNTLVKSTWEDVLLGVLLVTTRVALVLFCLLFVLYGFGKAYSPESSKVTDKTETTYEVVSTKFTATGNDRGRWDVLYRDGDKIKSARYGSDEVEVIALDEGASPKLGVITYSVVTELHNIIIVAAVNIFGDGETVFTKNDQQGDFPDRLYVTKVAQ